MKTATPPRQRLRPYFVIGPYGEHALKCVLSSIGARSPMTAPVALNMTLPPGSVWIRCNHGLVQLTEAPVSS